MKLYNKPELVMRTYRELQALGMSRGRISYTDLVPVDQRHHYHGTDAVDHAVSRLSIKEDSNVISLGSGLGGPARWIAGRTNATVLAVELQHSLHETAVELTKRCNLDSKVHHIPGDFLQLSPHLRPASYDAIVSWLTVLHIPEREKLFKQSFDLLKPNGYFYAEDFFELPTPLTEEEKQRLSKDVFCPYVPNLETYRKQVESSGLKIVEVVDLTEDWKLYTQDRVEKFKSHKESFVNLHGEEIYKSLLYFYQTVADLYAGGHLGGLRIIAQKN
jgi:cyclopropane fatty-acyl-phospholipid synthase-like methyltransferase